MASNDFQATVSTLLSQMIQELNTPRAQELFDNIAQGKMMRTKLIAKIAAYHPSAAKLAAIVELIHLASLLHDDVIDESATRRGLPTVHASFGAKSAVMLGDILYSKAFCELVGLGEEIAKSVSNAVVQLSLGELVDVTLGEAFNRDESVYFSMLYQKTASLIEACCFSAASLRGLDKEALATYGRSLGIAFQIVDDILDVTQDAKQLGKPSFGDFSEGKTTLPFLILYPLLSEDDLTKLLSMFGKPMSEGDISWVKSMLEQHAVIPQCIERAKLVMQEGVTALLASNNVEQSVKDELIALASQQLTRNF